MGLRRWKTSTRLAALTGAAALLWLASSLAVRVALTESDLAQEQRDDELSQVAAGDQPRSGPVALDDAATTSEGILVDIAVLANDRDPDGGPLQVDSVTRAENGWVLVNGDDTLRYQPNTGFSGVDGFAYTIRDGHGRTSTAAVSVHVKNVADAPVAEDQALETDEDTALAITLVASDADGDPLTYGIEMPPMHGVLGGTLPDLTYTPNADYCGSDSFVFVADDGQGGSDRGTISIQILPTRDLPKAIDDEAVTSEGMVIDIAVLANDLDPDGDMLRVESVTMAANGWVLVNGDHTLRYQPHTGFHGVDGFAYTVTDGQGGTDTATVNVRVQDVADDPVAENQALETDEDTALAITLEVSDADGDLLTYRIERPPLHGSLRGTPPDLTYTPHADYHGPDGFVFTAEDAEGGSDRGTISIRIHSLGDTPSAGDDEAVTSEGMVIDIAVLANDLDPDGDTLRIESVTLPTNGWVLVNGDHTLRYQPNVGFTGTDGFAYTVSDGHGGTDTATVSVRVQDVPDDPVAENQALETDEDTALAITLVASDADGDLLTYRIERPPLHGSLGGTPPDLTYTPHADYHGSDGFVFTAEDGEGGSDRGTISIRIHPLGDAPSAGDDEAATSEGMVVDIAVLANDRDPDGDTLKVESVAPPAHGWVLVNGDHTLRYQPNVGFTGVDGFAYTVADSHGGTDTATVSVRVQNVADAPVAEDQMLETDEDTALAITLVASDADGDPLSYRIETPPAHGALGGTPPDQTYTPHPNYHGSDSFVFSVEDGGGGSDQGTVSIQVHPLRDRPRAGDDEAATSEGLVVDIAVLANDSDPDGDGLRVLRVTEAVNGWVLINGDDTLRYQPNTGFTGMDGFAYTVGDVEGGTDTATVTVTVRPAR
jgi:hypothetical protein